MTNKTVKNVRKIKAKTKNILGGGKRLKCVNNKNKLDAGDKEIYKTKNNIKYRIVYDVLKVNTNSAKGGLVPKCKNVSIKIELVDFKTNSVFFAKIISKESGFVFNDDSKKEIIQSLKNDVLGAGWKTFDEYIERRVFPFFYAESKLSKMCSEADEVKGIIYRPIKTLYERLKKAPKGSIIRIQEKIALLRLFDSLTNEKPMGEPQLWTRLKTCLRENAQIPCRAGIFCGESNTCRECVIYKTIFPSSAPETFEWGRGIERPKKVSLSDIDRALHEEGLFEEKATIRNICKEMNVILDSKHGRKKRG